MSGNGRFRVFFRSFPTIPDHRLVHLFCCSFVFLAHDLTKLRSGELVLLLVVVLELPGLISGPQTSGTKFFREIPALLRCGSPLNRGRARPRRRGRFPNFDSRFPTVTVYSQL